jgi:DNA-directed RNA polymerase specialized sigma24 family protein
MEAAQPREPSVVLASPDLVQNAFRELHGPRLHGFALLLTLGDRRRAALLAGEAIAQAGPHLSELRHPERAAAWLRAHIVRAAGSDHRDLTTADRLAALADLGVTPSALAGLSGLGRIERGGLIATSIERLDARDVATVVGRDGDRLDALLRRARQRYLRGATAAPDQLEGPPGPIGRRIAASAARTMA